MMSKQLLLLLLLCSISLILAQPPDKETREKLKSSDKPQTETSKDSIDPHNYLPLIEEIQSQLKSINLNALSSYPSDIDNIKAKVSQISEQITVYEQTRSDLKTTENFVNLTNTAVNQLLQRMERMETDINTKTVDTSSNIANVSSNMESEMHKISNAVSREISDNTKRLEILEESMADSDKELQSMADSVKQLQMTVERYEKKHENTFQNIKERFENIERAIADTNKNLQIVYDSTVSAAVDRIMSAILDYLANFGEFCVSLMEAIKTRVLSLDWKRYYNAFTDPKQQKLCKDWLVSVYEYCAFWTVNVIQPAIIRQATKLYFGAQSFVKESVQLIHASVIYGEMIKQAMPYLEMGNIPAQYNGYVIDGILVLFAVSSLITLSFILGMCCDCCCPRIKVEDAYARTVPNKKTKTKSKKRKNNKKFTKAV